MKKKHIILFAVTIAMGINSFAQLGTPLSQFSGNQMVYNPGYAGMYELLTLNLSVRKSWIGIKDAPSIINFNGHAPFQKQRHAFGWVYQRETWGPLTGNFVYGNYGFKVYSDLGVLSLGIQAGFMNHIVDWLKIDEVEHKDDPVYGPANGLDRSSSTKFDANVGAFFLGSSYYVGVSALHLMNPKYDNIIIYGQEWYSQMRTQYFLIGGFNYEINESLALRPEVFMRYVKTAPLSVNIGSHLYYQNKYSFGINCMTGQKAISFNVKATIAEKFRIGYSYDIYYGVIKPYQRGSHEIMVNYFFDEIWWGKQKTEKLLWQ